MSDREYSHIVVADDSIPTQRKFAFSGEYQVKKATTIAQILALVSDDHRPAVITLDLGLPPSPHTAAGGPRAFAAHPPLAATSQVPR